MASNLQPDSQDAVTLDRTEEGETSAFRISSEPVIAPQGESDGETDALPRSYGSETLCLMARDPHSLFAFWDINWAVAFGEETPKQTTVHLRVLNAEGSEQTSIEVEPFAGSCNVTVANADASYYGEIGYLDSEGTWKLISRSETVVVPPEFEAGGEPADFATVPFHLSFQRMIETLRVAQEDDDPLTAMLADLRQRATSAAANEEITAQQRELLRVMDEAVASEPQRSAPADLWKHHSLERILGFGNSSLSDGFGGSSRS